MNNKSKLFVHSHTNISPLHLLKSYLWGAASLVLDPISAQKLETRMNANDVTCHDGLRDNT